MNFLKRKAPGIFNEMKNPTTFYFYQTTFLTIYTLFIFPLNFLSMISEYLDEKLALKFMGCLKIYVTF